MRYKDKHIREGYLPYKVITVFFSGTLLFGAFLLCWGFIASYVQLGRIFPLADVLAQPGNTANKTAWLEIGGVPQRITADRYGKVYYLVPAQDGTYIVSMEAAQYQTVTEQLARSGHARLEGMTKLIIDEQALADAADYIEGKPVYLRLTRLSYGGILKEGYCVNLILGGLSCLMSLAFLLCYAKERRSYRHPQAREIDAACSRDDAVWLEGYGVCLAAEFVVSLHHGLTAIPAGEVDHVVMRMEEQNIVMEAVRTDGVTVPLFVAEARLSYPSEWEEEELKAVFSGRGIPFAYELEYPEDEEDYEEDEDYEDE